MDKCLNTESDKMLRNILRDGIGVTLTLFCRAFSSFPFRLLKDGAY